MAIVADPKKILIPDDDFQPSIWKGRLFPAFSVIIPVSVVCLVRCAQRRPLSSGFQAYIIAVIGGGTFGYTAQAMYDKYNTEKNAMFRHYIDLHPEDFVMPERKKVGDVFPEFLPIR